MLESKVFVKNTRLFHLSILQKLGKEYVFDDTLHRKTVVLDNKNIDLKKSKNCSFPKTWYKTFHLIILDKIRKKNVFDDILYRKIAFLDDFLTI